MKKLYEWRAMYGDQLVTPPPISSEYDQVELDGQHETEESALEAARLYENAGGYCDLVLLTVYELSGRG